MFAVAQRVIRERGDDVAVADRVPGAAGRDPLQFLLEPPQLRDALPDRLELLLRDPVGIRAGLLGMAARSISSRIDSMVMPRSRACRINASRSSSFLPKRRLVAHHAQR